MNNIEFIQAGKKLAGFTQKRGYQSEFAFILGETLQVVKNYACGRTPVHPTTEKLIEELLKNES